MDDLDKAIAAVIAFGELSQNDVGKAGAMLLLEAHGQLTTGEVTTMIDPLIQSHYVVSGWCKALRLYAQQRAGDAVRAAGERIQAELERMPLFEEKPTYVQSSLIEGEATA